MALLWWWQPAEAAQLLATAGTSVTAIAYTVTPSLPSGEVRTTAVYGVALSTTPTLPTAQVTQSITGVAYTVTPSLPAGVVWNVVTLHPDGDVSLGNWTDEGDGTTDIYLSIDEETPSDADYVKSGTGPATDIYQFTLEDATDPETAILHSITYRYKASDGNHPVDLTVRLMQGAVEIASWVHNSVSTTYTTTSQTLSEAQANSISDYDDLRVKLEADQP